MPLQLDSAAVEQDSDLPKCSSWRTFATVYKSNELITKNY